MAFIGWPSGEHKLPTVVHGASPDTGDSFWNRALHSIKQPTFNVPSTKFSDYIGEYKTPNAPTSNTGTSYAD